MQYSKLGLGPPISLGIHILMMNLSHKSSITLCTNCIQCLLSFSLVKRTDNNNNNNNNKKYFGSLVTSHFLLTTYTNCNQ